MESLKTRGKRVLENLEEKRVDVLHKWEDKSREFIHSFLLLFGKDGRLTSMWNESRGKLLRALSPPGTPRREDSNGSSSSSGDELYTNFDDDDDMDQAPPSKSRKLADGSPQSAGNGNGRHISPDSSYHSAKEKSSNSNHQDFSDDEL